MKTAFTFILVSIFSGSLFGQCTDLYFSEYIEGSSSNKAIEIYNPSSSSVNLSDYVVYRNNNGSITATDSLFPVGILAAKDVFVIANPSSNATIMSASDTLHTLTFYNGDDAVWLKQISTGDTLDIIGVIGVDPGAGWVVGTGATNNTTLIRKFTVNQGQKNWIIGATEWDVFAIDMDDSLGAHSMTSCCTNTSETISASGCYTYTSPSGNHTWTTSGTYKDTIFNAAGCDSLLTINLTINRATKSYIYKEDTNSFTSPSGRYTWTTTGIYQDTLYGGDKNGCDSIIRYFLYMTHILYVNGDVSSSGNGITWGTAIKTLDEALNFGNTNDEDEIEIYLKSGTYYPGGAGSTNRDSAFVITNIQTRIYGGFSGVETDISQRNSAVNPTILCGDIGTANDSTDNCYHVLIILDQRTPEPEQQQISPLFVIDGLTIKGGNADGGTKHIYYGFDLYQTSGGGMVIYSEGGSYLRFVNPTISNCHFENNYADYGGAIFLKVPNGKCEPIIKNSTFKGNASVYGGALFNDGTSGETNPNILNCAFDNNSSSTSGAAIYNYAYGGEASPYILNSVFNDNKSAVHGGAIYSNGYTGESSPTIFNCTFHNNEATVAGGALYNYGQSGTCTPDITNSIFYSNQKNGDDDHNFCEIYNYTASPVVSYSSMQRSSGTYTTSNMNYLGGGGNNYYQYDPKFVSSSDGDGPDDVWRTSDDGLQLRDSSALINQGTNSGASSTDILGGVKVGNRDMGAYEFINCGLSVKLATVAKTHTASQAIEDDGFICYCNSDNELLLAIDTSGTGAVVSPSQVKLYIGNPSTLSYNSSGGMITNPAGGVVLERRWDVDPTTQPSSEVIVRYFYTNDDYNDIVTAMAGLSSPTTLSSPSQLQFYKVKGGTTATFPNPHDSGVFGIILNNGTTADTNVWVAGIHGVQDHSSEYLVSSFSGGGGGGGAGSAPLPVELIQFDVKPLPIHSAYLNWTTASETNNSHFVIERSSNGYSFENVAEVNGAGNSQHFIQYDFTDHSIPSNLNVLYYRLKQVDFDGTVAYSPVKLVNFLDLAPTLRATIVYPNPTKGSVTVMFDANDKSALHQIQVLDNIGRVIRTMETENRTHLVDLMELPAGLYFISVDTGESFKVIKN